MIDLLCELYFYTFIKFSLIYIAYVIHIYIVKIWIAEREASGSGVVRGAPPVPETINAEDEPETDDTGSTSGKGASPVVNPLLQERSNCEELKHVACHLETKDLWDKFNELGTEMIITKTGR